MGCDGGTIPRRDEMVKTKKKKAVLAKDIQNAAKWNHCHLSQEALRKPIVADQFGYMYNKEILIEYILDRSKYEGGPTYLKGLKDVKELNMTVNPGYVAEAGNQQMDNNFMFICPITGLQMNGVYKFLFLFNCGCVFSERAYKTLSKSSSSDADGAATKCIKCEKPFNKKTDLFVLNPNESSDLEDNKAKSIVRKEMSSSSKKSTKDEAAGTSKRKIAEDDVQKANASADKAGPSTSSSSTSKKFREIVSINEVKKSVNASSSSSSSDIQSDPKTSDVYKSLFTSHEKAKNQTKAHWVTFNPQYF